MNSSINFPAEPHFEPSAPVYLEGALDFTDAESRMIGQMLKASTTLPDDFWAVAVVQTLACLAVRLEPLLTDEQMAELVGIGGYIAAQGKNEMKAEIEMKMLLGRAGFGR